MVLVCGGGLCNDGSEVVVVVLTSRSVGYGGFYFFVWDKMREEQEKWQRRESEEWLMFLVFPQTSGVVNEITQFLNIFHT